MEVGMIAKRYAKALFELADEKGLLDAVAQDVQGIYEVFKAEPTLEGFLENPVVTEQQKKQLLQTAFGERVQPMVASFLDVLVAKNRESYLVAICLIFQQLHKEKEGRREVVLTTATPANEEIKASLQKEIAEKLNAKVEMKTEVDEKLIGGFKLRIDDLLLDESIATQLENIRKELLSK